MSNFATMKGSLAITLTACAHWYHALTARLVAFPRTPVTFDVTHFAQTRLAALVRGVICVVVVTRLHTHVTTFESRLARLHTAAFRYSTEVSSCTHDSNAILLVFLTVELHPRAITAGL